MHIDALGHPIKVGSIVLTTPHWNPTFSVTTKVIKITKKSIVVELPSNTYVDKRLIKIRRKPHQVIVIDKQLKYNQKTFPENLL